MPVEKIRPNLLIRDRGWLDGVASMSPDARAKLKADLRKEAVETHSRFGPVLDILKSTYDGSGAENSFEVLKQVAPYAHPNINSGFMAHMVLTEITTRKLGAVVGLSEELLQQMEAISPIHDVGKIIRPSYYVSDQVGEVLFSKAGIKCEVMPPNGAKLALTERIVNRVDGLTLAQIVFDVADSMAKPAPDGTRMRNIKEFLAEPNLRDAVYPNLTWPQERIARHTLNNGRRLLVDVRLYRQMVEELEKKGVDFDILCAEVWEEFNTPEVQKRLVGLQNALEDINPEVDKNLGRPKITTVLLDIGGTCWETPTDEVIFKGIGERVGVSSEIVKEAVRKTVPKAMNDMFP